MKLTKEDYLKLAEINLDDMTRDGELEDYLAFLFEEIADLDKSGVWEQWFKEDLQTYYEMEG
jgi:hypothetical protein